MSSDFCIDRYEKTWFETHENRTVRVEGGSISTTDRVDHYGRHDFFKQSISLSHYVARSYEHKKTKSVGVGCKNLS